MPLQSSSFHHIAEGIAHKDSKHKVQILDCTLVKLVISSL